MKTIEEAAGEWADNHYNKIQEYEDWDDDGFDEGYNTGANYRAIDAFKAGVEFAQRWIPIEEDLPPLDGKDYLLRNDEWIHPDVNPLGIRFGFYNPDLEDTEWTHVHYSMYSDEYITEYDAPTHWRYIDLK
ncbi:MAG: hypothetical protein LBQ39_07780 [Tannerellaceae bacterium]|jgi:hypothetical protein|nr:hypothetical protein [Tannerellaceae bacterium]